ncbi:MAG: GAF domain-containing protein [Synechococcales cyanobacterium CRU_2_2]|nr:GAF domain-containing protein [Synechococcales cyanobacterium CRU_2_2]
MEKPNHDDRSVLQDEQNRLALGLLVQALLAGGILTVAGALLATRATQPLLAAVKAVQEIGRGKWDVRLPVNGEDELATLASTLNQMAQQLESLNTEQKNTVLRAGWLSTITNGAEAMTDVELDESFSQVMAETRRLLGGDRVLLYRIDAQGQLAVAQESVLADLPAAIHLDLTETTLPESFIHAFQQNQPMAIDDALSKALPRPYAQLLETLQVRSELVVPLVENHQLSGLLVAQSCEPRFWQESEQTFLQQLAGQIGIAKLIQEVQTARGTAESNAQREKERTEELQRRVLQLLMEVDPVSLGDLTIRAKVTEDEIGTVADSYNATIESLRKIVGQVKDAVQQVSSTALTSETAVQELSDGANRQTAEIADALAKIQLMTTSIRMVAANAMQAEAAVQQAAQTVQAGDAAMNKTVEGIFGIRETVGEAAKKVKRLGESSQKISKVVNLIGSFAEQTNLLALNASIEAAHAGEEGRGFAVVADEVRSLARQSAAATAEIEALVAEIQSETNQVAAAMESGTEQVVAGTQLVENARQNLNQIAAVSEQISALVEAIAQATNQQTEVSDLVSQVMTNVSDIAQQTSGSATAVSGSFRDLVNVAQSLQSSVGRFKVS